MRYGKFVVCYDDERLEHLIGIESERFRRLHPVVPSAEDMAELVERELHTGDLQGAHGGSHLSSRASARPVTRWVGVVTARRIDSTEATTTSWPAVRVTAV